METRANYVLVGIFTLAVLILAFIVVYFIARLGDARDMQPLDVRIPGSVTGLGESSQVFFNGIRVGQVRRLLLDDTNPNMVIAKTVVNGTTPITRSTVATLGFQGLTGIAFIELKGGNLHEPNLLQEAARSDSVARINADPSTFNNLLATAQDIFARANATLIEFEGFIKDVRAPLTETVKNSQEFTATLRNNKDDINKVIADTRSMMDRLNKASENINTIMTKLDNMLSPNNRNSVVVQAQQTLTSIQKAADTLNAHIGPIANNLERFSGKGLRNVESFAADGRKSIQRIERAVTDLEQNPQRVIFGGAGSVPQYDGRNRR